MDLSQVLKFTLLITAQQFIIIIKTVCVCTVGFDNTFFLQLQEYNRSVKFKIQKCFFNQTVFITSS